MSGAPDEADMNSAGNLDEDPRSGTKPVAVQVPRVLTVADLMSDARRRALSKEAVDFCTTGHHKLDAITGGIRKGFTWLFGADTSFGKSSWLISVADENIKRKKRVLICSSEDTEEVYADRLMVRRAKVNALRFRDRQLTAEEVKAITKVEREAEPLPVYIDARRWCVEDLMPHLKKIIAEQKIDVVAFDYIQEFRSKKRWQDERVKYREIASQLRHLAKDAKISAILFSQLTLSENTKIPTRANIRECKDIANASEVILIGFEPDKPVEVKGRDPIPAGTKCLYIDKVKNGPRGGKVPMNWNSESACFENVHDDRPQPVEVREASGWGDQFEHHTERGDAYEGPDMDARYP